MLVVTIDNSLCNILNLPKEIHLKLKELLSYNLDFNVFLGSYPKKRTLLSKKGSFPTGLLYLVKRFLTANAIPALYQDIRKKPKVENKLFNLNLDVTPYKEQEEAAETAVLRERGIVCAPTGLGKSLIIALIINKLQVKTLIIVPKLQLKIQLTESLKQYFGNESFNKYVTVENIQAIDPNIVLTDYHCVIIDEFHRSASKTYVRANKVAWSKIYYKFGLTATPFRTDDNERLLLESVLSEVIYEISYKTALDKGYIALVEAYYIEVPSSSYKPAYTWPQVYSKLITHNEVRNNLITSVLKLLQNNFVSTLTLVKEVEHGNNLKNLLKDSPVPFAHGENDNNSTLISNFNSKAPSSLIGTTGVMGEGVDTKAAEFIVIAGLGKSRGQFMQQVGRGLRKYPKKESCKVIIFKDKSHKWTINHYNQQVKFLKEEYDVIPVKLSLKS